MALIDFPEDNTVIKFYYVIKSNNMKSRLAINGFGRIGRSFVKAALEDKEFTNLIDIVAINDPTDAKTLAHLFKYDSVFGKFDGTVEVDNVSSDNNGVLVINNLPLKVISEKDPSRLPCSKREREFTIKYTSRLRFTSTKSCGCGGGSSMSRSGPPTYIYALGKIIPRIPNLSVEKNISKWLLMPQVQQV